MGDQNLRVWPVTDDGYGNVIEYPAFARYRMEPQYPGATGDRNTDLVVYKLGDPDQPGGRDETELGRHCSADVLIAFAGQPTPDAVYDTETARRATVDSGTRSSSTAAKSTTKSSK